MTVPAKPILHPPTSLRPPTALRSQISRLDYSIHQPSDQERKSWHQDEMDQWHTWRVTQQHVGSAPAARSQRPGREGRGGDLTGKTGTGSRYVLLRLPSGHRLITRCCDSPSRPTLRGSLRSQPESKLLDWAESTWILAQVSFSRASLWMKSPKLRASHPAAQLIYRPHPY